MPTKPKSLTRNYELKTIKNSFIGSRTFDLVDKNIWFSRLKLFQHFYIKAYILRSYSCRLNEDKLSEKFKFTFVK